jgi:chromate transporter
MTMQTHPMRLIHLFLVFSLLSVLALGGGNSVLPEMQHMTVHRLGWLTDAQFRSIYSLGQVVPGPNMLMVLVIGYHLAGWLGMIVVGIAFFVPDFIIALSINRLWLHLGGWPWRVSIQRGLAPVAIGLMISGTYTIAKLSVVDVPTLVIALVVFAILSWRHVNPGLLVLGGGAVLALLHG